MGHLSSELSTIPRYIIEISRHEAVARLGITGLTYSKILEVHMKIKLDQTKLLGFRIVDGIEISAELRDKSGGKPMTVSKLKLSAKLGTNVGMKPSS